MSNAPTILQADALHLPLADQSVDLVLGSPPYVDARLYLEDGADLGISRGCAEWVDWMLDVTTEALRVSRGAVVWVAKGATRDRTYWPACEGLMWEWYKRGGSAYRPAYWHRVSIPGSGGDQWLRDDVEYVMLFKRPGSLPWSDNTAMGHPPKWGPGGEMSHRLTAGQRVNEWGKPGQGGGRRKDGSRKPSAMMRGCEHNSDGTLRAAKERPFPVLANPGNLISTGTAGGGKLGNRLAHENEAPYPEALVDFIVRTLCPPEGVVLDPFNGSGTTIAVAQQTGRRGVGVDVRMSQCQLTRRRLNGNPLNLFDSTPAA